MSNRLRLRTGAPVMLLGLVLAGALAVPIPGAPDPGRSAIERQLAARLPGWKVDRVAHSWEGAFTVVASCVGHEIGFQYVPDHGLGLGDAWLQPSDPYSRDRLSELSDHYRYLIWFNDPALKHTLSCREELARHRVSEPRNDGID
jgi:hypothetical protein